MTVHSSEIQSPHDLGSIELLKETLATTAQLADKQIQLLRAELTATIAEEKRRVIAVAVGGGFALCGASLLLTAAALAVGFAIGHPVLVVLGLGLVLAAAAAALLVAGIRALSEPPSLGSSRQIMEQEIEWAKGKLAETKSSSSPET